MPAGVYLYCSNYRNKHNFHFDCRPIILFPNVSYQTRQPAVFRLDHCAIGFFRHRAQARLPWNNIPNQSAIFSTICYSCDLFRFPTVPYPHCSRAVFRLLKGLCPRNLSMLLCVAFEETDLRTFKQSNWSRGYPLFLRSTWHGFLPGSCYLYVHRYACASV